MKFSVLTIFPEMFESLKSSIIGRAEEKNLINLEIVNIKKNLNQLKKLGLISLNFCFISEILGVGSE